MGPGAEPEVPRRARVIAGISIAMWIAVIVCGRLLTFYRPGVCGPEDSVHGVGPQQVLVVFVTHGRTLVLVFGEKALRLGRGAGLVRVEVFGRRRLDLIVDHPELLAGN